MLNKNGLMLAVIQLYKTTRVPMALENICAYSGVKPRKAQRWLDALVRENIFDMDVDDDGVLTWRSLSQRPESGPERLEEIENNPYKTPRRGML